MTEMQWSTDDFTQAPLALIGDLGATNARIALVRGDQLLAEGLLRADELRAHLLCCSHVGHASRAGTVSSMR